MGSQAENSDIFGDIREAGEALKQRELTPGNGHVLPVELDSHHCGVVIIDFSLEPRQEGQHDENLEFPAFLVCLQDFVCNDLHDHILFADEKLVFNVDEFLGILYQIYVGFIDGPLVLLGLESETPSGGASQDLVGFLTL